MCRHLPLLSIPVLALTLLTAQVAVVHNPAVCAADEGNPNAAAAAVPAKTRFLILGKSKVADPPQQQQRGIVAVRRVAKAARSAEREAQLDALVDDVMTIPQYRRGQATETVTGKVFRERLRQLKETATPHDTVIIYTHSHGRQNGFETSQPHGGLVMDLPVRQTEHAGAVLWDEYAERLLEIPAKNGPGATSDWLDVVGESGEGASLRCRRCHGQRARVVSVLSPGVMRPAVSQVMSMER